MKNFRLPLSLLIAASVFTSCIDDEVSEDVQAIRTAQALNLTADADLTNAQTAFQEATTAAQELTNLLTESNNSITIAENAATLEADVALALDNAVTALTVAELENMAEVIAATQEQAANITGTQAAALTDYIAALGQVTTAKRELVDLTNTINELMLNAATGAFTTDDAIAANDDAIEGLDADKLDLVAEQDYLEGILADPASIENTVIDLQEAKEGLEDDRTDAVAALAQASAAINLTFSDDVAAFITAQADVIAAEGAVRTAEEGIVAAEEAVVTAEEGVVDAQEVVTEAEEELVALGAAADLELSDAEDARDEALEVLTEANDVVTELNDLATDYNAVIAQIAAETALLEGYQATLLTADTNIALAQAEYDVAQAVFNANASGMTVTDPGADNTAGEPNDVAPDTFRLIAAVVTGTPNVYTFSGPNYDALADIPGGGTEGTAVGEYFNVETDDTVTTTEARFTAAVTALTALELSKAEAEANVAGSMETIAELQAEAAEFDATEIDDAIAVQVAAQEAYDLTLEVVTAVEAVDMAKEGVEMAEAGVITAQDGVTTAIAAIETAELALVDATQDLVEAEADLVEADALISDDALAEYNAAQQEIDDLEGDIEDLDDQIADIDVDILFYEALTVEFDVTGFDGVEYEDRIEAIEDRIAEIDSEILALDTSIDTLTQENVDLDADLTTAEDVLAGNVEQTQGLIDEKLVEIAGLEALAEEYLAILNGL